MKNIIKALMSLTIFATLHAQAQEVPAYLKDAEIVVRLKNGTEYKFSSNEWAVVPRKPKATKPTETITIVNMSAVEESPNRFTLHAGRGYSGLNSVAGPGFIDVSERATAVFGVSYARKLGDSFSLGVSAFSNKLYTLDLGFDLADPK